MNDEIETCDAAEREPKYVVFDTETTGLFIFKDKETGEPIPADDPRQPRMASFAAIIADEYGKEISREKIFVKPDGWSIDGTHASEVNGLTDAFLMENGAPVSDILDAWEGYVDDGLIVAAFNAQFDCKMMRAELRRADRDDMFEKTMNTCLMRGLAPYKDEGLCVVRGYVKLKAACEYFDITYENAHDAMADAEAALGILKRLIADDRVIEPKVHYAKNRSAA
ncbi:MAG: exonuclease domain-containing protein [Pikeienuella sp.]